MQIRSVTIHNFRSVTHGSFELSDHSLLIGANNTGKSNVIDALRVFYEKDNYKFDLKRDFPMCDADDDGSWIEVEYQLNEREYANLKVDYQLSDRRLRVRKYLMPPDGRKPGIYAYESEELSSNLFYAQEGYSRANWAISFISLL